jgi:hypothetical protein
LAKGDQLKTDSGSEKGSEKATSRAGGEYDGTAREDMRATVIKGAVLAYRQQEGISCIEVSWLLHLATALISFEAIHRTYYLILCF